MGIFVSGNDIIISLVGNITAAQTSILVSNTANFPSITAGNYFPMKILNPPTLGQVETIYVTAVTNNTITVLRGQEGSSAYAWINGDTVYSSITAAMTQMGFTSCVSNSSWAGDADSTSTTTGTLTAPCNGYAICFINGACIEGSVWAGLGVTLTASLSGLQTSGLGAYGEPGIFGIGWLPMTTGQSTTFTGTITNSSDAWVWVGLSAFFVPIPS